MKSKEIIEKLESLENPTNVKGMARFGIVTKKAFGITAPELKQFAKEIKKTAENRPASAIGI